MSPPLSEYVEYRLQRAYNSLKEAESLVDGGFFNTAFNRLYYGCFYAVNALLWTQGLASSKHSGVRSMFNQHFVKKNVLPHSMGSFYDLLFDNRMRADYEDFLDLSKNEVEAVFPKAREFVDAVAAEARKQLLKLKPEE